ncbi:substrate-binding domain-containing protein [Geminicoccus flavidas]|uniref:substrate-binding domain-containing protein n=1 Tax=Geminicoccus flavidas TaxID=2506407 RepID=UPI001358F439|nr:substrate-binding domain-containing protein [Geminicoccus flavidas]
MKLVRRSALVAAVLLAGVSMGGLGARAQETTILASVPSLTFPFFVHMLKEIKDEATKLGVKTIDSDGQNSAPKQTADVEAAIVQGVQGIVISPSDVNAMAPALATAVENNVPVVTVDRRVDGVEGILAHVGADNVKGGEAQGEWLLANYPDGAKIINLQGQPGASPAIDRNKGLHNVLDKQPDKYQIVAEQTANFARDQGLSVTESILAGMSEPPDVIIAANDDMALGALEAVRARNLGDQIKIVGFDALPEALASIRDGGLAGTVEQFPGGQSRRAVQILVDYIQNGKSPEENPVLLTPIVLTKDNLDKAERLGEVQ